MIETTAGTAHVLIAGQETSSYVVDAVIIGQPASDSSFSAYI